MLQICLSLRDAQTFQESFLLQIILEIKDKMHNYVNKKDYYTILGLDHHANQDQIKKMYKKLAVRWHPDKNLDNKETAKQRFRQIAEAYQILSDEKRRNQYDKCGINHRKTRHTYRYNYQDANDLFKNFFKSTGFETAEDQEFFNAFNRKKSHHGRRKKTFESMFDDQNFWTSGLSARMNGFSPKKMTSPGKLKRTVNTVKQIMNGKIITTKTTTLQKHDGSKKITQQKFDQKGERISYHTYEVDKHNKTRVAKS